MSSITARPWSRLPTAFWIPVTQLLAQIDWAAFARASQMTRGVCALLGATPFAIAELSRASTAPNLSRAVLERMRPAKLVCTGRLVEALPVLASRLRHLELSRLPVTCKSLAPLATLVALESLDVAVDFAAQLTRDAWPPALVRLAVRIEFERSLAPFDIGGLPATLTDLQLQVPMDGGFRDELGFRGELEFLDKSASRLERLVILGDCRPLLRHGRAWPRLRHLGSSCLEERVPLLTVPTSHDAGPGSRRSLFPALELLDLSGFHVTPHAPWFRMSASSAARVIEFATSVAATLAELALDSLKDDLLARARVDSIGRESSSSSAVVTPPPPPSVLRRLRLRGDVAPSVLVEIVRLMSRDIELVSAFCGDPHYAAFHGHRIACLDVYQLSTDQHLSSKPDVVAVNELWPASVGRVVLRGTPVAAIATDRLELAHEIGDVNRTRSNRNALADTLAHIHRVYPQLRELKLFGSELLPSGAMCDELGDFLVRFRHLAAIDLSGLRIGKLEPRTTPLEFVRKFLYAEQHALVTALPRL